MTNSEKKSFFIFFRVKTNPKGILCMKKGKVACTIKAGILSATRTAPVLAVLHPLDVIVV